VTTESASLSSAQQLDLLLTRQNVVADLYGAVT
jgi:hypothetical protein